MSCKNLEQINSADGQIVPHSKKYKGIIGCFRLYRFLARAGDILYKMSEKCALYSRDRDRLATLDEKYKKRMEVGTIVVDTEKRCGDVIKYDEVDISCEEVTHKLGKTYSDALQELEYCREIVLRLWHGFKGGKHKDMEKIFMEIGLYKTDKKEEK